MFDLSNKLIDINIMSEERIKKLKIYTYRYAIENFESKKFEKN